MIRKPKLGLADIIILCLLFPVIIQALIIVLVPTIGLILALMGLI